MACEVSLSTSRFRNTSYYCTHPTLIKKSSRSPGFFFSNTFGGTTLIVNSGNHNHEKCATNKKFPNRHVQFDNRWHDFVTCSVIRRGRIWPSIFI